MPGTPNLVVDQRVHLDYDLLRRAIQEAAQGLMKTETQSLVLAEVRTCRPQIASPLDQEADRPPNPTDRARFAGREEVTITMPANSVTAGNDVPTEIRLGPDLIAVAFALADELNLNEIDTAVLLSNARNRALTRPDRDVVAAAKELYAVYRRHSALYLQEILRAGLLAPHSAPSRDDTFISALMRERDLLVAEHNVFNNVANRIRNAWKAQAQQAQSGQSDRRSRLQPGELLLLAETIFLLSYTVQLSKDEAALLRVLLTEAEQIHTDLVRRERSHVRSSRAYGAPSDAPDNVTSSTELLPPALVEAESVRNLFLLAWMCALDRSRYRDTYDPRTGRCGVNLLLKDPSFFPYTLNLPKLESEDAQHDPICNLPKAIAAAELCGAIFRLAVAEPDEHECVTSFVRLCAYNEALPFLTDILSSWIEKRAGSMSPDADLYADVLEDLANDIAEAPHVLSPLLQFVIHEVQYAAATAAYGTVDTTGKGSSVSSALGMHTMPYSTPVARRARPSSMSVTPQSSAPGRRLSMSVTTPRGRPPLPPSVGRSSGRPSSLRDGHTMAEAVRGLGQSREDHESTEQNFMSDASSRASTENILSSLSRFIARAVALAPSKLSSPSASGGLRYWSSVGPSNWGFIQRIGDAVMDLWDLAMRNPYFPGGVGFAFRQALNGYLELLASTCMKHDSAAHALAALRFLVEGGHSVVSLERLLGGLSIINSRLGAVVNENEAQVDEADCEVLRGIVNIISHAADAVRDHGGILTALGERGKELAMNVGALAIHNVPVDLKEVLIRSLGALGDQRSIATFLETVAKDKAAPLRHYLRSADAQSGEFDVTIRVLELASLATAWNEDEMPDSALESVATWFAIEEVLMYWSRRKYTHEAHRWHIVHAAGTLIREFVYNDLSSSESHRVLAHLLTPAPGTGAASFAFKSLIYASGLIRAGHDHSNPNAMDPLMANLYRVSGKAALELAIEQGLGDAYRMMQEAVRTSSRILSLLLEASPGRMSIPAVSVVPAAELLNGELSSIAATTSMVFNSDSFLPQISRAGYSGSVCSAVLAMLSRAARGSENVAALFWKARNWGDLYAAEFRTSLGNIIAQCDPTSEVDGSDENGIQKFTILCKEYPDPPLMHSALALVEACLGRDGGNKPGIFLLGLNLDAKDRYESTQYGVLSALIQLVAGPTNGDGRSDSMSRATAATFLERLAANTVQKTSLAVLEHLKEIGSSSDLVRGVGFGDEMLFRVMDAFQSFESHSMGANVNWAALGALVSSCLSLSALQVRVFPEYEREQFLHRGIHESEGVGTGNYAFSQGNSMRSPPSPLDLLRLLHTMASSGGDLQTVSEAFRNWYFMLGTRLSVHEVNEGYCSIPLLFEVSNVILEATAQSGTGHGFSSAIKNGGGEIAGASVLSFVERIRLCDKVNTSRSEELVSDAQCAVLLSGIIRSLAEMTGIGINAERGRTSLYSALLICEQIAKKHLGEDVVRQELGRRVGQRSGTEVLINAACVDAVGGARAGTKCAALAVICMVIRMDGVHAVAALEAQGRLRKVMQVCLRDPKIQAMVYEACWSGVDNGDRSSVSTQQAAVAVVGAVVGVIHSVAASGHGMRLLTECGCVESIASLLPGVFYRRVDTAPRHIGNKADLRSSRTGFETGRGYGRAGTIDQRRMMLNSLIGALAAAVSCAGGAADKGGAFIIGEGGDVFVELLRNVNLPGCIELEMLTSIGVMMARLPDEVVMGSDSGLNICGWLASVLGTVVPAPRGSLQMGSSESGISAGVACREPDSVREARRVGILHPEGGSLYERDILGARSSCAQSLFAALRNTRRALRLFSPELEETGHEVEVETRRSDAASVGNVKAKGTLADVVRICNVMIREAERAAEESMQIESKLAGDGGASYATLQLNDLSDYYFEEHGIERESLTTRIAMECLKDASSASKRHGTVCISVFESGLFVIREFICMAKDIVRGRFDHTDRRLSFSSPTPAETPRSAVTQNDATEVMSVIEAEQLLEKCKQAVLPLCAEIEGLADSVWCGKSSSFSKQVCRQIRTACSADTPGSCGRASQRLSVGWTQ